MASSSAAASTLHAMRPEDRLVEYDDKLAYIVEHFQRHEVKQSPQLIKRIYSIYVPVQVVHL